MAYHAARLPGRCEDILAGISSGAAWAAAYNLAARCELADRTIIVVLPDTGEATFPPHSLTEKLLSHFLY